MLRPRPMALPRWPQRTPFSSPSVFTFWAGQPQGLAASPSSWVLHTDSARSPPPRQRAAFQKCSFTRAEQCQPMSTPHRDMCGPITEQGWPSLSHPPRTVALMKDTIPSLNHGWENSFLKGPWGKNFRLSTPYSLCSN